MTKIHELFYNNSDSRKQRLTIILKMICCFIFLSACSSSKDDLNGSYERTDGDTTLELDIDGNDALISIYGQSLEGTVDRSKKTITFKDKKETVEFSYKIVGEKLSVKSDDLGSFSLIKMDNKKGTAKSKSKSETSTETKSTTSKDESYEYEDFFYLETGEYEVGTDIKPGAYVVDFEFYDYSEEAKEDGNGYIEVTHGDSVKKYDFENSDVERRIILKDGDLVNSVPENSDSDFSFSSDEE